MGHILYIDPIGGLAGDMLCAALLDAGLNEAQWREGLSKLNWSESVEITVHKTMRGVFSATHINISPAIQKSSIHPVSEPHPQHHGHHHGTGHNHSHTHPTSAHFGPSSVPWANHHRGFTEISNLISQSDLPSIVQQNAIQVFRVLGEAEASIHGSTLEDIHFHEVGAVDSILDIVGFCYGLYLMDITSIIAGAVPLSTGEIHTAHGRTPLPAPATARILHGWPSKMGHPNHEQVTPTGAAIIKALGSYGAYPEWTLRSDGYGAGTRNPPAYPNLVRVCIGELKPHPNPILTYEQDEIIEIQSNIDDMSAEHLAPLIDHLLSAGAVDAHLQSIIMKKGRPGFLCTILSPHDMLSSVLETLFTHSTTFGCRIQTKQRAMLTREWDKVETPWGLIDVKVGLHGNRLYQSSVEFEQAQQCSLQSGIALQEIYRITLMEHHRQYPNRYPLMEEK